MGRLFVLSPGSGRRAKARPAEPEVLTCRACRRELPIIWFHKDAGASSFGRKTVCRECHAYGVRLRKLSRGKLGPACEVCGAESERQLDHDHASGLLRGTLCRRCNRALGDVDDDPERLIALAAYLRAHVAKGEAV